MDLSEIDYSKFYLQSTKKGYKILYDFSKFKIYIKNVQFPFGLENYNGKNILNFKIVGKENSDYNNYATLLEIQNIIHNYCTNNIQKDLPKIKVPPDFEKDMRNKEFSLSIKEDLIRTYTNKNCDCNNLDKKKLYSIELELTSLWMYENSVGLLWVINQIY